MRDFIQKIDQWLDRYAAVFPFSGGLRITQRDRVLYRRDIGLANREWNLPITADTRFRLYSMTKPLCALGFMRLVDQGLASLDDHPGKYVPEAAGLHPAITMRMLMNHTSGLPDFAQADDFLTLRYTVPPDTKAMIQSLVDMPMNAEPGASVRYINAGFFLISLVTQTISDMPWAEYMEKQVFAPLNMSHSGIDSASLILPNRAAGYDFSGMDIIQPPALFADWMMGAGAGYSTVDDFYQLHIALRDRLLVSEAAWNEILTPSAGFFGLGCSVTDWHGKTRIQHNGGYTGFRTLHIHLPEDDFDVILLSNMGFGNIRAALAEAVYALYYEDAAMPAEPIPMDTGFARSSELSYPILSPQHPPLYPLPLENYTGDYVGKNDRARIVCDGFNGLNITLSTGQILSVYPIADHLFANRLVDETYRFSFSHHGQPVFSGMTRI